MYIEGFSVMRVCSQTFFLVRDPSSVPTSRRRLHELTGMWGLRVDEGCEVALSTVVSELVTNAVQHSSGAMLTVAVRAKPGRRRLLIEVYDASPILPQTRKVDLDAEDGRGMLLVKRLAISHGAEHTEHGKRVWVELALPEQPMTRRQLILHPRRAARAVARRLSPPHGSPISLPAPAVFRTR